MVAHDKALAEFMKVEFLNAGDFTTTYGVDGIHFTPENNATFGRALAARVLKFFADGPKTVAA